MKKILFTLFAASLIFGACKNNEEKNVTSEEGHGLENTRTDPSEIEGDRMPIEVATGMDTTTTNRAEAGAAGDNDGRESDALNESSRYGE